MLVMLRLCDQIVAKCGIIRMRLHAECCTLANIEKRILNPDEKRSYHSGMILRSNEVSSATRPTGRNDCNSDAMAGFAAAHG